ncbi:hypothetical protein AAHE18_18G217700 [Arachis hypogaea]
MYYFSLLCFSLLCFVKEVVATPYLIVQHNKIEHVPTQLGFNAMFITCSSCCSN